MEDQFSYEMDIFAGLNLHYRLAEKGLVIPALKGFLDKYSDNGRKDIYILGGSMGGMGTWNMLSAYPGYFKGAMPVAFDTPKDKIDKFIGTRYTLLLEVMTVAATSANANLSLKRL